MTGDTPVLAETEDARVTATGVEVIDGGATVVFVGPARLVFDRGAHADGPAQN